MRLFETGSGVERNCATCCHSTPRHGRHTKGTYPLVCLLMACPVTRNRQADWPCRTDFDGDGPFPRGWEARDG